MPSGLAVFKDLIELEYKGKELIVAINEKKIEFEIKVTRVKIPSRILMLKSFLEKYLKTVMGMMDPAQQDRNEMTVAVLKTVKFMMTHGFYKDQTELAAIA